MKKILAGLIALILSMLLVNTAFAVGKLTVVQENFVVLPRESYYEGIVYVELQNTGDKAIEFSNGLYELYDKDGTTINSLNLEYYDCNPEVLQPGESAFMRAEIPVETATEAGYIVDHSLSILGTGNIDTIVTRFPTTATYKRETAGDESYDYIVVVIGNDTDESLFDFYVTYVLRDAQGKLIYTTVVTYSYVSLMPHAFTQLRVEVRDNVVTYLNEQGIIPDTAEAIAFKTAPK